MQPARKLIEVPSKRFLGKVAMVTGSTEGIGFGIARRLAQEGADVMISSRKQENVDEAVDRLRSENLSVEGVVCHVGNQEHRKRLVHETVKRFGGINILINNAAFMPIFRPAFETTEELWDKVFDTNVKAPFFLTKLAIEHLGKTKGSSVLFISSVGGYHTTHYARNSYTMSKTTLFGMTKALVPECTARNIRVNCLAPGLIDTKAAKEFMSNDQLQKNMQLIPMNRMGSVEECGGIVAFLCSDDATYITGEVVCASGGGSVRL
ncbi:dehydrogenase/reductase SDR family member 4-like [Glandiceps talaboti]